MCKEKLIIEYLKHIDHWVVQPPSDCPTIERIDEAIHGWSVDIRYGDGHYTETVNIDTLDLLAFVWSSAQPLENNHE
ncbi:hypothetical protein VPDG_00054 [Vibrio phage henriette 12B8]|uniref:hypothetical protein n=1 Tax=Vibrio phage henriette 12B8 TaxID=573174 RepID=UPI0002C0951D|nr:hypothetical protein VPDG_00054 [Vibrio phage henriette 12B8]AGG58215.1 hypothetical protein VPDG_00054 [Vibrio phage henriette 12B8]